MNLSDVKKDQIAYRYERPLDGGPGWRLERVKVVSVGKQIVSYVKLNHKLEVRSGINRIELRAKTWSYEPTPTDARLRLVRVCGEAIETARRRLIEAQELLDSANAIPPAVVERLETP